MGEAEGMQTSAPIAPDLKQFAETTRGKRHDYERFDRVA